MYTQFLRLVILFALFLPSLGFSKDNYVNIKTSIPGIVAITLDACGGETDMSILQLLKSYNIPATVFVTSKWLYKNPQAIDFLKSNTFLFKVEDHGYAHHAAVFNETGPYNLPSVRNIDGLISEVNDADADIYRIFGYHAHWYRTAGALYDEGSLEWLKENHWNIGGYTIAADEGATASKYKILNNINRAKPGDVLLFHINKPKSDVFVGLREGLPLMLSKNYKFGFLN